MHISHTHSNTTITALSNLTPLQLAVCEKDLKTVELVLEQGVDVNECHAGKRSALGIAASNHSYEMCSALLARGASVRAANADGLTVSGPSSCKRGRACAGSCAKLPIGGRSILLDGMGDRSGAARAASNARGGVEAVIGVAGAMFGGSGSLGVTR